ncbi:MAG: hypothetical protein U0Z53_15870 [Blastocatellia bacterium]
MLIILLLIVPTALPATTGLCAMMEPGRFSDAQSSDEMSCCPSDASHCPMTANAQAEQAFTASADADDLKICECGASNQSAPPALATERQTSTLKAAPDVISAPAEPDYRPVAPSHHATFPQLPSAHHHHSCLRI